MVVVEAYDLAGVFSARCDGQARDFGAASLTALLLPIQVALQPP